ncbi:MAG: PAS domain-containing protein [Pseudomonadota bacterium]
MSVATNAQGRERFFDPQDLIVSKTNLKGHLTYTNRTFLEIAGYSEKECQSKPHNMIRHRDMPRCVFKLLWDTIQSGREVFAYVVNACRNGDHYWVYAHVTPTFDETGTIIGYHSTRRSPDRDIINTDIKPLYERLRAVEDEHANRKAGLKAGEAALKEVLAETGMAYDEFVATIGQKHRRGYR